MIGKVIVMEPAAFQTWLAGGKPTGTMADLGARGCSPTSAASTCHMDATPGPRPVAATACSATQVTLANGEKVTADEAYIRESILTPTAKMVAGFPPLMPTFQGVVSEEQIAQLTAYIKSLASTSRAPATGTPAAPAGAPAPGRDAAGRGSLENDYGSLDREADELPERRRTARRRGSSPRTTSASRCSTCSRSRSSSCSAASSRR